jgi:hypothetical protein
MQSDKTDYPFTVTGDPDYGMINITIPAGRTLKAENSAMAYMDSSLTMKTKMGGGLKRMLSGEKLFINEFTASESAGDIGIAPGTPVTSGTSTSRTKRCTSKTRRTSPPPPTSKSASTSKGSKDSSPAKKSS